MFSGSNNPCKNIHVFNFCCWAEQQNYITNETFAIAVLGNTLK